MQSEGSSSLRMEKFGECTYNCEVFFSRFYSRKYKFHNLEILSFRLQNMRKWFSCKEVLENTYIKQHHIKILKMRIFNKRITTNIEQLLVIGMALPPIGGGE